MSSQPERQRVCVRCHRVIPPQMKWKLKRGRFKGPVCQRCLAHLWRQKGYAAERDLVRRLEKLGYSAIRIPTSAPGQISLPDVIAFHNPGGPALSFEVKAVSAKRWTVFAWKEKRGKKEPSQIVKCFEYLRKMYPPSMEKHVAVAIKFLLGARVKAPWIIRFVPDPGDLSKLENVTVSIEDSSDMPELTASTKSRRSRFIIRRRKERSGKVT